MTANAATVWKKPISALLQVDPNRDQGNGHSVWELTLHGLTAHVSVYSQDAMCVLDFHPQLLYGRLTS